MIAPSVWVALLDGSTLVSQDADRRHPAASLIKVPLVVAAYRLSDLGRLDLDRPVLVHNRHRSAVGSGHYANTVDYDQDDETWAALGRWVPLRWLCRRALVVSGNLATNLVLEHVRAAGWEEVATGITASGAGDSVQLERGIQDAEAGSAGLRNTVTAQGIGRLMMAVATGTVASAASCAQIEQVLADQFWRDGIAAGLPVGMHVACKSGWIDGVAHDVAIVRPPDRSAYVIAVCLTDATLNEEAGFAAIARTSAAVADRLASPGSAGSP